MPASLRGRRNQDDGRLQQRPRRPRRTRAFRWWSATVRPVDGRGTNPDNPDFGATGSALLRLAESGFRRRHRRNGHRPARCAGRQQYRRRPGRLRAEHGRRQRFHVGVGSVHRSRSRPDPARQYRARQHRGAGTAIPISTPTGRERCELPFFRGVVLPGSGTGEDNPREFANTITGFIDASMVYGSDAARAASLRVEGGKIIVDAENNLATDANGRILTGDVRAGENQALLSMHTMFAREHNRLVDELAERDPSLTADELYQAARTRVEAEVQAITYNEYLPMLVGRERDIRVSGLRQPVNPGISLEFATAVFRLGHSQVSPEIQRLLENGQTIEAGNLDFGAGLRRFAVGGRGERRHRSDPAGAWRRHVAGARQPDRRRSALAPDRRAGQWHHRSRVAQHPAWPRPRPAELQRDARSARVSPARQVSRTSPPTPKSPPGSKQAYGDVDLVDLWVGGLSEDDVEGGMVGETFAAVLVDQFERLRDGDPFWSQNSDLPPEGARRAVVDHAVRYHRAQHRHRHDAGQRLPCLRSRRRRRGR